LNPDDIDRLQRCLVLAHQSIGLSDPNPRVGCVLHDAQGQWAADGFTQQAGGHHAEAAALHNAAAASHDVRGGTAWVSLEPCAHHGRTPPCCDALIDAGVSRVVVATGDPFPQVAGQGLARLRAAGVQVVVADGTPVQRAAQELNIGFFSRVLRQRPWLRMKVAASLDGRTALDNGSSQWITGPASRADGHRWRQRAQAVLTGIGTVLADDPRLDVRELPTALQPLRVVLDSDWQMPPMARLLSPPGEVLIVGALDNAPARSARLALERRGAQTLCLPAADGRVDLGALLTQLAARGVNELHVEAGAVLNAALLRAGWVDEVLAYVAPTLIGPGRGLLAGPALERLADAVPLRFLSIEPLGPDLRLLARVVGSDAFLG